MKFLIILFICFTCFFVNSQNKVDKSSFLPHLKAIQALQKNEIINRNELFKIYDYYSENNHDSLYFYANRIIELGIRYENWNYINCGKAFMVSFFNKNLKIDIATQLGQQSLEYFINKIDYEMISFVQNQIGISYTLSKDFEKAKLWFFKSLESGKQTGDYAANAVGLQNIAETHYRNGEYDSALHYINIFVDLIDIKKNRLSIGKTYNTIGNIYREKGDNERAISYYKKSLLVGNNKESSVIKGNAYTNLGIMYFAEDPILARSYFLKALNVRKNIGLPTVVADSYLNLGHWYFAMEKMDSAIYYYRYMLDFCTKNKHVDGQIEAYEAIKDYYEILKDNDNAQRVSKKREDLFSWSNEEKQKSLSQYVENTNNLFLAEDSLSENNKRLASYYQFDNQMGNFRTFALIILLISSVIGISYYVYNKKGR